MTFQKTNTLCRHLYHSALFCQKFPTVVCTVPRPSHGRQVLRQEDGWPSSWITWRGVTDLVAMDALNNTIAKIYLGSSCWGLHSTVDSWLDDAALPVASWSAVISAINVIDSIISFCRQMCPNRSLLDGPGCDSMISCRSVALIEGEVVTLYPKFQFEQLPTTPR